MPTATLPQEGVSAALLWDLDNVSVALADLNSLTHALSGLVPVGAPRIASANWRAFRLCGDTLRAHGIRVVCGARNPDGADGVLLRQARRLRKGGVERFLVASNDHAFARIANFAELHVVTLTSDYMSSRLRSAASSVTVLTRDERGWQPRDTALSVPGAAPPRDGPQDEASFRSCIKEYLPVSPVP